MKYFSSNVEFLRRSRNLTQTEIQSSTGIERTTWSNYERGKSFPNLQLFSQIVNYFDISADDLLNTDLSKHQVSDFETDSKNSEKHQVKRQVRRQVSTENRCNSGDIEEQTGRNDHLLDLVDAQRVTIKVLEASNARLEQIVSKLEEENYFLKREIPTIGGKVEDQQANVG